MHRRGGGGGGAGSGGVDAHAARQLFMSLFGGALNGGGQNRGRGPNDSRGGRRLAAGARPRPGEWSCQCGFATNRSYREACLQCGRARDVAEVGGEAGATGVKGLGKRWTAEGKGQSNTRFFVSSMGKGGGPIGAGGSRPLLGGRDRSPPGNMAGKGGHKGHTGVPMWEGKGRGPPISGLGGKTDGWGKAGQSISGKGGIKDCTNGGGDATRADADGPTRTTWTRPSTVLDDDGYELVQPRKVRVEKGVPKGAEETATTKGGGGKGTYATYATVVRRRWSDEEDSGDEGMDDQECDEEEAEGDAGGDEAWDSPARMDPRQLRAEFEELARAARELERRGNYGPALATLQAARDEAEKRWRDAKPPAPLAKRLDWADTKLRKAQAALTKVRLELDAFDEDTDRRRAEICSRIHEAERWCQWRRRQLDEVHEEAAESAPGRRCDASGGGEGTEEVRERIRTRMLPEMQAIIEEVLEGTDLHGRLALFAAGLADAEAKLGYCCGDEGPTTYHMGDDDSQEGWDERAQGTANDEGDGERDQVRGSQEGRPTEWKPEGPGRWTRTVAQRGGERKPGQGEAAVPAARRPAQASEGSGTGDGGRTGDSTTAAGAAPAASAEEDDGDGGRAGKHRRRQSAAESEQEERNASDARRAEELRRQVERASEAQEQSYREGRGGFGSEAALSAAAQGFVLQVQRAQAQASELGVEPRAQDGRTLLQLSPAELEQWVRENLGDDTMRD